MDTKIYEQFFDTLQAIIDENRPQADKVEDLKKWMREQEDNVAHDLEEFMSWFDQE